MPVSEGSHSGEQDDHSLHGSRVYKCKFSGCGKTFGTAGHVRRHEKSHAGVTPYRCPHCPKAFVRSDVRAKHVSSMHPFADHGIPTPNESEPPQKVRRSEADSPFRDSSTQGAPIPPQQPIPALPPVNPPGSIDPRWSTQQLTNIAPQPMFSTMDDGHMTSYAPQDTMLMGPTPAPAYPLSASTASSGFMDPNQLHAGSSTLPLPQPDLFGSTSDDIFGPLSNTWPSFSHIFGWGLDTDIDVDLGMQPTMFENSEVGPISSTENLSAAWLLSFTPRQGSPAGEAGEQEEMKRDPFGRNHDSPWPSTFRPKLPDRALTLGGVKARPRAGRTPVETLNVEGTSRNAMLSLVYLSHQAHWLMPDIEDFPDQDTLSDFVDLYFEKFHPTFPILHRPTFKISEAPAVQLLAVAAVGATFAAKEYRPLAIALAELVRRIVQWMRASDQRAKFDRNILMSYMLQSVVGIGCGSREMMLHTEISRASLVTSLRRLHLLRSGRSATDELISKGTQPSVEDRWQAWIEDETKRRFGWGIYLLDSQFPCLIGLPAMASLFEAAAPCPSDDRLWEASDAKTWWDTYNELKSAGIPKEVAFLPALGKAVDGKGVSPDVTDFGRSLLALSIYRMVFDESQLRRALKSDSAVLENAQLPVDPETKPYEALQILARDSASLSTPSYFRLCPAALYHHSRIAFSRPRLLDNMKVASGKFEPDLPVLKASEALERWARDGAETRRLLWHAGVLTALLVEYPSQAMAEAFWMFDCALVFWTITKLGMDTLGASKLKSALFAANWFDVEPPRIWIEHGGQVILPGLGSSASLTCRNVLEYFIEQLEKLPWGMAGLYRQVLGKLLDQEDQVNVERRD